MRQSFLLATIYILPLLMVLGTSKQGHASEVMPNHDAPAVQAAHDLLHRVLPEHVDQFTFQQIPQADGHDVFELESLADGRILIRGNNAVSMASGLNWYLKHYAKCQITWRSQQLNLPSPLPKISSKVQIISPHKFRYYFNYCAFSYTMAYWDWNDWQRMIDLLALYGVNAPLSVTGQEGVWREVGRRFGLSDQQMQDFYVGPAYLPFGWMGCIDRWAGPLDNSWIDRHIELEKKILQRERELGMKPILQGFTGHAPRKLQEIFPDANIVKLRPWSDFESTYFIDPADPLFVKFGKAFLEEQTKLYGTNHLYASDTFIEMPPTDSDPAFLKAMGQSIYRAMEEADPDAIWVLQGWLFVNAPQFWKPPQTEALLRSVPQDKLLVLDLHCENIPTWSKTNAFYGQPWVWCIIQNFGGTVSLHGALDAMARDLSTAMKQRGKESGKLQGIGYIMEGLGWNPIVDEFQSDMVWREEVPSVEPWIEEFVTRRYGANIPPAQAAWKKLHQTAYQWAGRHDNLIVKRPTIIRHGTIEYPLLDAWKSLLDASDQLADQDTYKFDVINVTRQALGSLSSLYVRQMINAFHAKDHKAMKVASDKLQELVLDIDTQLGTHDEFLLGTWLERAKRWATTDQQRRHYEWNTRTIITLWGKPSAQLDDYSNRQWSGMMRDYYARRWQLFYEELDRTLVENRKWDAKTFDKKVRAWQAAWTHETKTYSTKPNGQSPAKTSAALYKKYRQEFDTKLARSLRSEHPFNASDYPPIPSLTTGKPVTCSDAMPEYPAKLANDGIINRPNAFWGCDVTGTESDAAWWCVDFEEPTVVGRVLVIGYYRDYRIYGFLLEGSLDGKEWFTLADHRNNQKPSTIEGHECKFTPQKIRYLRVTQTSNTANSGRHLIEVAAFAE